MNTYPFRPEECIGTLGKMRVILWYIRYRFEQIMRCVHCNDNTTLDKTDKMTKLRTLMEMLRDRFIRNFVPEREIDYDECMIEYFRRHDCKQYICGKPIRFGYKVWFHK